MISRIIGILIITLAAPLASAQSGVNEEKLLDRYLTSALNNPRRGPTVERMYRIAMQVDGIDALIERIQSAEDAPAVARWTLVGLLQETRGRDADAIEAYTKAARADESAAYPRYYLGALHLYRNEYEAASEQFLAAMDRELDEPDAIEVRKALGRCYLRSRQMDKARETWAALAETAPDDPMILEELTALLVEEEQWDEALKYYGKLYALLEDKPYEAVLCTIAMGHVEGRRGRFDDALQRYETALERVRSDSWLATEVRRCISELFRKRNDLTGLADYYTQRLASDPKDLKTQILLARLMVELDRRDEAREAFEAALELAPTDRSLRLAYIDLLELEDDHDEAIRQYEHLVEAEPRNTGYLEALGDLHLRRSRDEQSLSKARELWGRIAELNPDDPMTLIQVADIFQAHGMNEDAEKFFKLAVESAPEVGQYREYYGEFLVENDRRDDALAVFKGIAAGSRRSGETLMRLAEVLGGFGFHDEALAAAREAVETAGDGFQARMLLVDLLSRRGEWEQALKELDAAAKVAPNAFFTEQVADERIRLLSRARKLADVFKQKSEQLKAEPSDDLGAYVECAKMAMALYQPNDALPFAERAVDLAPDDVAVLELAARVYHRVEKHEAMVNMLGRLIELAPQKRGDYYRQLAQLNMQLGLADQAIESAEKVIAAAPDDPNGYQLLSRICDRFGMQDRSLEVLNDALRVDAKNTELRLLLARQLEQMQRYDAAVEQLWIAFESKDEVEQKISVIAQLADVAYMAGSFDQVVARLERMKRLTRDDWVPTLCMVEAYKKIHEVTRARELLATLRAKRPDEPGILKQMVDLARKESDTEQEVSLLEELIRLEPSERHYRELANALTDLDRIDEAVEAYREAAERDTGRGHRRTLNHVVADMIDRQLFDEALAVLEEAGANESDDWRLRYLYGVALGRADRSEAADEVFLAIADLPEQPEREDPSANTSPYSPNSMAARFYQNMPPELERLRKMQMTQHQVQQQGRAWVNPASSSSTLFQPMDLETARFAAWYQHCQIVKERGEYDAMIDSLKADGSARALWRVLMAEGVFSSQNEERTRDVVNDLVELCPQDAGVKIVLLQLVLNNSYRQKEVDDETYAKAKKVYESLCEQRPDIAKYAHQMWMSFLRRVERPEEMKAVADRILDEATDDVYMLMMAAQAFTQAGQFDHARRVIDMLQARPQVVNDPMWSQMLGSVYRGMCSKALEQADAETAAESLLRQIRSIPGPRPGSPTASVGGAGYVGGSRPTAFQVESFPCQVAGIDRDAFYMLSQLQRATRDKENAEQAARRQASGKIAVVRPATPAKTASQPADEPSGNEQAECARIVMKRLREAMEADAASDDREARLRAHLVLMYLDYWADDKDGAIEHMKALADIYPNEPDMTYYLALVQYACDRKAESLETVTAIRRRYHPVYKKAQVLLMSAAEAVDDKEAGKTAALRLMNMQLSTDEQLTLASKLHGFGLSDKAKLLEERATALTGDDLRGLYDLLRRKTNDKEHDEVLRIGLQMLVHGGSGGNNADYYRRRALDALKECEKTEEAIAEREKAVEKDAGDRRAMKELWYLYMAKDNWDKASATAGRLLEVAPKETMLRLDYAKALMRRDDGKDEAIRQFEIVLRDDASALLGLDSDFYQIVRDFERAGVLKDIAEKITALDWQKILRTRKMQIVTDQFNRNIEQIAERMVSSDNISMAFLDKANDYFADNASQDYLHREIVRLRVEAIISGTNSLGYVKRWHMIGPFDNSERKGLNSQYAPEVDPFDPAKKYEGKDGQAVEWHEVTLEDGVMDAIKLHHESPHYVVYYARSVVERAEAGSVSCVIDSNDGARMWLNGELVYQTDIQRGLGQRPDKTQLTFRKGENEILLKIDNVEGNTGFSLQIEDEQSRDEYLKRRFDGLRYLLASSKVLSDFTPPVPRGLPEDAGTQPLGVKTREIDVLASGGWTSEGRLVHGIAPLLLDLAEQTQQLEPLHDYLQKRWEEKSASPYDGMWLAMVSCRLKRFDEVRAHAAQVRERSGPNINMTAIGWMADECQKHEALAETALECNAWNAERESQQSTSMQSFLLVRLARSHMKLNQEREARKTLLKLSELEEPNQNMGSYRFYEKQRIMHTAAQQLREFGFYRDAYNIAGEAVRIDIQEYGTWQAEQIKALMNELEHNHPDLKLDLAVAAVPLQEGGLDIVWSLGRRGREGVELHENSIVASIERRPGLLADYQAVIQVAARRDGPFHRLDKVAADQQMFHYADAPVEAVLWYRVGLQTKDDKLALLSEPVPAAAGDNLIAGGSLEEAATWTDAAGQPVEACRVVAGGRPLGVGENMILADVGKSETQACLPSITLDPDKQYFVGGWLRGGHGRVSFGSLAPDGGDEPAPFVSNATLTDAPSWTFCLHSILPSAKEEDRPAQPLVRHVGLQLTGRAVLDDVFAVAYETAEENALDDLPVVGSDAHDADASKGLIDRLDNWLNRNRLLEILTAVPHGDTAIELIWSGRLMDIEAKPDVRVHVVPVVDRPAVFAGYTVEIQVAESPLLPFRILATVSADQQRYMHEGVPSNKLLYYRLVFRDEAGEVTGVSKTIPMAAGANLIPDGEMEALTAGPATSAPADTAAAWQPVGPDGRWFEGLTVEEDARPYDGGRYVLAGASGGDAPLPVRSRPVEAAADQSYLMGCWLKPAKGELMLRRVAMDEHQTPQLTSETATIKAENNREWTHVVQHITDALQFVVEGEGQPDVRTERGDRSLMPVGQRCLQMVVQLKGEGRIDDAFLVRCDTRPWPALADLPYAGIAVVESDILLRDEIVTRLEGIELMDHLVNADFNVLPDNMDAGELVGWKRFGSTNGIAGSGKTLFELDCYEGEGMYCGQASWGGKNGGAYQVVRAEKGVTYAVSCHITTRISGQNAVPGGVKCRIGIDPTGGHDPGSPEIAWSDWFSRDDYWREIMTSATAKAVRITVFIEHTMPGSAEWNVALFDDVRLDRVEPKHTSAQDSGHAESDAVAEQAGG